MSKTFSVRISASASEEEIKSKINILEEQILQWKKSEEPPIDMTHIQAEIHELRILVLYLSYWFVNSLEYLRDPIHKAIGGTLAPGLPKSLRKSKNPIIKKAIKKMTSIKQIYNGEPDNFNNSFDLMDLMNDDI